MALHIIPPFLIFSVFSEDEPDLNNELEISVSSNFHMVIRKSINRTLCVIVKVNAIVRIFINTNLHVIRNHLGDSFVSFLPFILYLGSNLDEKREREKKLQCEK